MSAIKGMSILHGVHPIRQITNIPADATKIRIRMRNNDLVRAFVRFPDRVEHWIVGPDGGKLGGNWELLYLQGANSRRALP